MAALDNFNSLSSYQQALIAVAILIDGREAVDILGADIKDGQLYRTLAVEFGALDPELRISLMGTMLRRALEIIEQGNQS